MKSREEVIKELEGQKATDNHDPKRGIGSSKRSKRKEKLYSYLQKKGKAMDKDITKDVIRFTVGESDRQAHVSPHANSFQLLDSMFDKNLVDRYDSDGEWVYWLTSTGMIEAKGYIK